MAEIIMKKNPKYLGISSDTINIFTAAELAEKLKKSNPQMKVIIGGPHVTAAPEETMKRFPSFDIGVLREGELTIVELLELLKNSESNPTFEELSKVPGIIYRNTESDQTTRSEPRKFIKDLDTLPLPAWDLLPDLNKYYVPPGWSMHRDSSAVIITSRGCPSQCTYCDRAVFGNYIRLHSADYVMKMLHLLYYKYKIRHFRINEDNFVFVRQRVMEVCNRIIKENLKITWSCFARADRVDLEMLKLMKKAGCWQISYGVETGCQKIHDVEKKNVTLEQTAKAVKLTRQAKIRVVGFNMIGHPLETVKTMQATIDFNKKIKVDDFKTQFLMPFPGTELYQTAEQFGDFDRDWKKMAVFKEPIFIPYGLTKEQIIHYNKKGFWQFYTQPRVIFSYLIQVRKFSDIKTLFVGGLTILKMVFKKKKVAS